MLIQEETANYILAVSMDRGDTFEENIEVSCFPTDFSIVGLNNSGLGIGEYTQVIGTSCYAIPIWSDGRTNDGNLDIYAAFIPLGCDTITTVNVININQFTDSWSFETLYPNPSKDWINAVFDIKASSTLQLEIVSITGKVLKQRSFSNTDPGIQSVRIPVEDLAAGNYILRVTDSSKMISKGFQVVK